MLEDILSTKTKAKIASLFARERGSLQVSDVARKLGISKSRASECLRDLEKNGLLRSKQIGRSIVYELSSTKLAMTISDALGQNEKLSRHIEKSIKTELMKLKPTGVAMFGSGIQKIEAGHDIDIIALFDKNPPKDEIYRISAKLTEESGIHVSILAMSTEEFREKAKKGEEFAIKVAATNKHIYGKKLEEIIWSGKSEKKRR